MKHPMQKQHIDDQGVKRFVENKLVSWLIDQLPGGLNSLSKQFYDGDHHEDDYDQILQLIGYSVSGIPYRDSAKYNITDLDGEDTEEAFERMYRELKEEVAGTISDLNDLIQD